ncbi:unannotated protein [freshwater metagenome]|uniref:Unannotated protein n=1 Tax=freshwater metagenome TaxID=449393 RepID=A0A6J7LT83_9ZZZZ
MRSPSCRDIGVHGVGRQVEGVAVTAGAKQCGVTRPAADVAGDEIASDDASGNAVFGDDIEKLSLGVEFHIAKRDLLHEGLVGAEQKLLTGLATGVERTADLRTTERTVIEKTAVFTSKGNALCHALIDDVDADLGKTVNV